MNKNTNLAWPLTYCDSWEMLENILVCLKQAVIVTDLSGRICFTSPVVKSLFGFTSGELEGKMLSVSRKPIMKIWSKSPAESPTNFGTPWPVSGDTARSSMPPASETTTTTGITGTF